MLIGLERPSLSARLKTETAEAHRHLETALALLEDMPDRRRLTILLERFHGFHARYEPAVEAWISGLALPERRRLGTLRADLVTLGHDQQSIDRLPVCDAVTGVITGRASALGAVYVMEGSTLGGKMINRALRDTAAWPEGGIGYFDPHGARTGAMWNEVRHYIAAFSSADEDDEVIEAARETFALLARWLAPAFGTAS